MEVERLWGKYPGWFDEQPREAQVRLLAHRRVLLDPKGTARKPGKRGRPGSTGRRPKNIRVASDSAASFWGV